MAWEPYSPEKLAAAGQSGRPAVLYFSAAWCPSCMEMKSTVFGRPRVIAALEPFAKLRADVTFVQSSEVQELTRRYRIEGVPTLLLFDAAGGLASKVEGYVDEAEFLDALAGMSAPAAADPQEGNPAV